MGQVLQLFTATIPAGTTQATPHTVSIDVGPATVNKIRWRVPPGPAGVFGWHLAMGNLQVLPAGPQEWVVADDEYDEWSLSNLPDEGEWQLTGYNTGRYDHSVYLWFTTTPLAGAQPAPVLLFPTGLISSG